MSDRQRVHYSRNAWGLFGIQAAERFAFYGMLSVLVLFMVAPTANGGVGRTTTEAIADTGAAAGLVYVLMFASGWISDRITGPQWMVGWGLLVATTGYLLLALPVLAVAWIGLGLALFGVGMVLPNVSALVANEFPAEQGSRDSAFSTLYVAQNAGAFFSPIVTGIVALSFGWDAAFAINAAGTAIAFGLFAILRRRLNPAGRRPLRKPDPLIIRSVRLWAVGVVIVSAIVLTIDIFVLTPENRGFETSLFWTVLAFIVPVIFLARLIRDPQIARVNRDRLLVFVGLFAVATLFWLLYSQKLNVLVLMANTEVDRNVGGFEFPANWFFSLDPLLVVLLGPPLAALWLRLGKRDPSTITKFAGAMATMAVAFAVLAWLLSTVAPGELLPWIWVVGVYVLMSLAELLLGPIGSSVTTRLAPPEREAQMLAMWYLAIGAGFGMGGLIGSVQTTIGYTTYFLILVGIAAVATIAIVVARPRLLTLMHGVR